MELWDEFGGVLGGFGCEFVLFDEDYVGDVDVGEVVGDVVVDDFVVDDDDVGVIGKRRRGG